MNKNLKLLISKTLATTILTSVISSSVVFAKTTDLLIQDTTSKNYLKYKLSELNEDAVNNAMGLTAPLYDEYKGGALVAFADDKTGYVDQAVVNDAAVAAAMDGTQFDLDAFTEAATGASILGKPSVVTGRKLVNGVVVDGVIDIGSISASSVSAVSETSIKVTFTGDVDATTVANYLVTGVTVTGVVVNDAKNVTITTSDYIPTDAKLSFVGITAAAAPISISPTSIDGSNRAKITLAASKSEVIVDKVVEPVEITFSVTNLPANTEAQVEFKTTWGQIVQTETTTNQRVVVKLYPQEDSEAQIANITAKIVSVQDTKGGTGTYPVYKNVTPGLTTVKFTPATAPVTPVSGVILKISGGLTDQADRVYVNFDKPVPDAIVASLTKATSSIKVYDDITVNATTKPIGVSEVLRKDSDTLVLVLDRTDANFPLTDNAKHSVTFDYSDKVNNNYVSGSSDLFLEDSNYIKMMKVYNQTTDATLAYNQLKVVFNEAVNDTNLGEVGYDSSVRNMKNWVIDGLSLKSSDIPSKDSNNVGVKVISTTTNTTERETVILTFKDPRDVNEFISDKAGTITGHKLQINSMGDWAAVTDSKNIVSTQELQYGISIFGVPKLSFVIDGRPTEVTGNGISESPEQFIARFSGPVGTTATSALAIIVPDLHTPATAISAYDTTGIVAATGLRAAGITTGAKMVLTVANGGIVVKQIDDVDNAAGVSYLIQLTSDWTQKFNTNATTSNYHDGYYNQLKLVATGYTDMLNQPLETVAKSGSLDAINVVTLAQDVQSPFITDVKQLTFSLTDNAEKFTINVADGAKTEPVLALPATTYGPLVAPALLRKAGAELVYFNEPVQIRDASNNFTVITPSQQQTAVGIAVPNVTFEYVQVKDEKGLASIGNKTYEGRITTKTNYDNKDIDRDYSFIVEPVVDLPVGEYQLVVRSLSDDIGNTMVTTVIGGTKAASVTDKETVVIGDTIKITSNAIVVNTALMLLAVDGHHTVISDKNPLFLGKDWLLASEYPDTLGATPANNAGNANSDIEKRNDSKDIIHVQFNKAMYLLGDNSILNKNNYRLDGAALPVDGTSIVRGIKGEAGLETSDTGVTIILPDGYLQEKDIEHVLTIQNVVSADQKETLTARIALTIDGVTNADEIVDNKTLVNAVVGGQKVMHKVGVVAVVTTALTNAITAATTNSTSAVTSADGTDVAPASNWVTAAVKTTYTTAIAAAQAVVANVASTQANVDAAVITLATATTAFNAAKKAGTQVAVVVTKAALIAAGTAATTNSTSVATSVNGSDVLPANSWVTAAVKATYTNAIAAAQAVANDAAATQAQVDLAVTTLAAATTAFNAAKQAGTQVAVVTKVALVAAGTAATTNNASVTVSVNGSDVLPANSWVTAAVKATYTNAITAALAVNANAAATQAQVDTAVTTLAAATTAFNAAKQPGTQVANNATLAAGYTFNPALGFFDGTLTGSNLTGLSVTVVGTISGKLGTAAVAADGTFTVVLTGTDLFGGYEYNITDASNAVIKVAALV